MFDLLLCFAINFGRLVPQVHLKKLCKFPKKRSRELKAHKTRHSNMTHVLHSLLIFHSFNFEIFFVCLFKHGMELRKRFKNPSDTAKFH